MASIHAVVVALLLVQQAVAQQEWNEKINDEGRKVQEMKIQAPSMTEEDQYGYTMPDQYRCDSCKVVVHHLSEALQRRQPKNRRLKEWEYQEVYDETCMSGLSGYGISLINGENTLSGPALKRDNLEAGMGAIQMGGETWEKRLGEICRKIVYEKVGEDELYEEFRAKGELSSDLCFSETRDCQLGPKALPKVQKVSKSKGDKKSKQKKHEDAASKKAADIDLSSFIGKLAKSHGVAKADYTQKRSFSDWESLFVLAAQRISEQPVKQSDQVLEV